MKKKIGTFGARQFSLGTLVGGQPGTTIFQNPGGGEGGGGWGVSHTRTGPGRPPGYAPALEASAQQTKRGAMRRVVCTKPFHPVSCKGRIQVGRRKSENHSNSRFLPETRRLSPVPNLLAHWREIWRRWRARVGAWGWRHWQGSRALKPSFSNLATHYEITPNGSWWLRDSWESNPSERILQSKNRAFSSKNGSFNPLCKMRPKPRTRKGNHQQEAQQKSPHPFGPFVAHR